MVASVMLWGRSARKASTQLPKLLSRDKTLADDPGIDKIPGTSRIFRIRRSPKSVRLGIAYARRCYVLKIRQKV